jgi:hypothetical protein
LLGCVFDISVSITLGEPVITILAKSTTKEDNMTKIAYSYD